MKTWLQRWLSSGPELDTRQAQWLASWQALPERDRAADHGNSRYVVLDVETTGLNLMKDTLISIGAIGVVNGRIAFGDSFSVVLQQPVSSDKENILVHGISGSEQLEGEFPVEALLAFLEFIGKDPLVAFHVTFDETMIRRAMKQYLGFRFAHPWLDLAYVLPAQFPRLMHQYRSLDDWSGCFHIINENRHNALADALVTAQLLLVSLHEARRGKISSYSGMRGLEREFRENNTL